MRLNIFSRDVSRPLERTTALFAGVARAVLASIASAPSHAKTRHWSPLIASCSLAILVFTVLPVQATVIQGSENPKLFGNLNQADTNCPNDACGPTAAVNSFVFLQNMYPKIYDNKLVPAATATVTQYQQYVNVANTLSANAYMHTCATCGTYIEEFITGKQAYIEDSIKGVTNYAAEDTLTWRPTTPDGVNVGPKPSYVQDNTAPTLAFLAAQLTMGEDVELFINASSTGSNHYVTLTDIFYDDAAGGKRFIDIVDPNQPTKGGPAGPPMTTNLMITGFDPTDGDILLGGGLGYLGTGLSIVNAVAESPIPEPSTMLLTSLALLLFGVVRNRRFA